MTWLDPKTGLELSAAAGFTFNGENRDTDYKTGAEFHVEWAVMEHNEFDVEIRTTGNRKTARRGTVACPPCRCRSR